VTISDILYEIFDFKIMNFGERSGEL